MDNPYEILGITPDASPDEVKKAYRKKARENHPDLNPGDSGAQERMNEINEAYDRIMNPDKYRASDARKRAQENPYAGYGHPYRGGYASPYGSDGPYGWTVIDFEDLFNMGWNATSTIHPEASVSDSNEVRQAVSLINTGRFQSAMNILMGIPENRRNARWHYLMALANNGMGNTVSAYDDIKKARNMDPTNQDYAHAEDLFEQRSRTYQEQSTKRGFSSTILDPNWMICCICLGPSCCSYLSRMFLFC